MDEGTVRMQAEMYALVAEMHAKHARMEATKADYDYEGPSAAFFIECAQCFEEIARRLREEV